MGPMIMALTVVPASSVVRSSVLGGSTSRALAVLMLSSRLLHWLPVLETVGVPSFPQERKALWYSGRGSRDMLWESCREMGSNQFTECGDLCLDTRHT